MKVQNVIDEQKLVAKLKLTMIKTFMGGERVPDIVRVLFYRPEFFGTSFNHYCQTLLRGASEWTIGERELFATWVSKNNDCAFCMNIHKAVASQAMGFDVSPILASPATSDARPQVKAMLALLEKLTRSPQLVAGADIDAVRQAGVSDAAIEQGIHICAVFSSINRIADSLGFEVPGASALVKTADFLLKRGYEV